MKIWKDKKGIPQGISFRAYNLNKHPCIAYLTFKDVLRIQEQFNDYKIYLNEIKK